MYPHLKIFFCYSHWMILTIVSSRSLMHSSISLNLLLIPSSVFFISVTVVRSEWFFFFFIFSRFFLLKFYFVSLFFSPAQLAFLLLLL